MSPRTSARICRSGTDPTTSIASTRRSLSAPIARPSILSPEAGRAGLTALMSSVLRPSSSSTSPARSTTSTSSGLRRSATRTPMVLDRVLDNDCAARFIRYPEFVSGLVDPTALVLTHHRLTAHHQRDQRLRHPARSATSRIVGRRPFVSPCAALYGPPGGVALFRPVQYDTSTRYVKTLFRRQHQRESATCGHDPSALPRWRLALLNRGDATEKIKDRGRLGGVVANRPGQPAAGVRPDHRRAFNYRTGPKRSMRGSPLHEHQLDLSK